MNKIKRLSGGVLAPRGFLGGAVACGIKSGKPDRVDLALLVSESPASCAATFTTNEVKAAPVRISMEHLQHGPHRAVILNSGNANACTGEEGMVAARAMAAAAAEKIGVAAESVMVCSTGRIGVPLPFDRIVEGVEQISLTRSAGEACARAIMTSDTVPKHIAFSVKDDGGEYRLAAMAKGAGMIDPKMATMLAVITTDAIVSPSTLRNCLKKVVERTFNRITVDGDMSTNDTVVALANGAFGVRPEPVLFQEALERACAAMARMIVADGEGVSRFVEVGVSGAASLSDARRAAEAVANSTLVKCAWAGGDPNWGRIMDALGYSGAKIVENRIAIDYSGLPIVREGRPSSTPSKKLQAVAAKKSLRVDIDLGLGKGAYEVWTTDLTEAYVKFNLGE